MSNARKSYGALLASILRRVPFRSIILARYTTRYGQELRDDAPSHDDDDDVDDLEAGGLNDADNSNLGAESDVQDEEQVQGRRLDIVRGSDAHLVAAGLYEPSAYAGGTVALRGLSYGTLLKSAFANGIVVPVASGAIVRRPSGGGGGQRSLSEGAAQQPSVLDIAPLARVLVPAAGAVKPPSIADNGVLLADEQLSAAVVIRHVHLVAVQFPTVGAIAPESLVVVDGGLQHPREQLAAASFVQPFGIAADDAVLATMQPPSAGVIAPDAPVVADGDVQLVQEQFIASAVASPPVIVAGDAQIAAVLPLNAGASTSDQPVSADGGVRLSGERLVAAPVASQPILATADAQLVVMQPLNAGAIAPDQPVIADSGAQLVDEQFVAATASSLHVLATADAQPAATQLPSASTFEPSLCAAVSDAGIAEGVGQPAGLQITAGVEVQEEHLDVEGGHAVPCNVSEQLSGSAGELGDAETAAKIIIRAIIDMAKLYARQCALIFAELDPEIRARVCLFLRICLVVGALVIIVAAYFGSYLLVLAIVLFLCLVAGLLHYLPSPSVPIPA